jgi:hypothetical protein
MILPNTCTCRIEGRVCPYGSNTGWFWRSFWNSETFAYADEWNQDQNRYLGLRAGGGIHVSLDDKGPL